MICVSRCATFPSRPSYFMVSLATHSVCNNGLREGRRHSPKENTGYIEQRRHAVCRLGSSELSLSLSCSHPPSTALLPPRVPRQPGTLTRFSNNV